MIESDAARVLADLGAIPSAPLHELAVATCVGRFLRDLGLPFQVDQFGNIIATYRNGDSPRPLALVAHLDHPAIEISSIESPSAARAALLGGVQAACFNRPVPIVVVGQAATHPATIVGHEIDPTTGRVSSLAVQSENPIHVGDFGVFDVPGFAREGDELAMRAADDLIGVAAALLTLRRVVEQRLKGIVHGVFTRAEEIGLIGAALIASHRLLPENTIIVSLECSRPLPGAEPGHGPVIRVGDRTRAFHPEGEAILLEARERLTGISVQRQLMSLGTCEATAFGLAGYRTTGVALPVVNYHNMGADDTIVAERIMVADFLAEIELLVAACECAASPAVNATGTSLDGLIGRYRRRLEATAPAFRSQLMV